eukprot:10864657-Alexandrium_andersonii.AAC.1
MHPECQRHRGHTRRSARPTGPGRRPHADAPADRKEASSRAPCCSSCSGAAPRRWSGRPLPRPSFLRSPRTGPKSPALAQGPRSPRAQCPA